jgi:hypothetical protein
VRTPPHIRDLIPRLHTVDLPSVSVTLPDSHCAHATDEQLPCDSAGRLLGAPVSLLLDLPNLETSGKSVEARLAHFAADLAPHRRTLVPTIQQHTRDSTSPLTPRLAIEPDPITVR